MGQFARSVPTPKDSGVTSVAISPLDGRVVAAVGYSLLESVGLERKLDLDSPLQGSLDKMVRLWDARTGQLLERFDGHKDSVYSVAFSSDGKSIVSGSLDKTLKIWDISPPVLSYLAATAHIDLTEDGHPPDSFPRFEAVVTTTCRHTFSGHKDFVLSVAYGAVFPSLPPQSEDECREWVVSGSKDRSVTFWDARGPRGRDPATVTQFMLQGHKNSGGFEVGWSHWGRASGINRITFLMYNPQSSPSLFLPSAACLQLARATGARGYGATRSARKPPNTTTTPIEN